MRQASPILGFLITEVECMTFRKWLLLVALVLGRFGVVWCGSLGCEPGTLVVNLCSGLKWRRLGPFRGGRVDAVTGVPGRPNEFYFGSVNGGGWKKIDGGRGWAPVFDGQ